ncbi:hypothetical protein BC830DRAFT_1223667 [Chytriomyces sp. MP71]|nr:hypothetical protein BC830DRAFT_1223667 [Chytriomyces sp. MP71]
MPSQVTILFFAAARDRTGGLDKTTLALDPGAESMSVARVIDSLRARFPDLTAILPSCMIAVNMDYVDIETAVVKPGDEPATLFCVAGAEEEGWEVPQPWIQVRAKILELEAPEGHYFLVRYFRASIYDPNGVSIEAAWPVEFEDMPHDALDGVLMIGVATADGLQSVKDGWEKEFELGQIATKAK